MPAVPSVRPVGTTVAPRGHRSTMTVFGVIAACLQHPGVRAAVITTTGQLLDIYRREALAAVRSLHPVASTWRKGELHLNNGAVIMFRTMTLPPDVDRFAGMELQLVAVDQHVPADLDAFLISRLRSYDPTRPVLGAHDLVPGGGR